jgi:amino acid adenylation domain-containing protein
MSDSHGRHRQLSFAQERLWFVEQWEPGTATYNLPLAVRVRGALDVAALASAVSGLIARHEALRTTFAEREGEPVQVIHAAAPVAVRVEELGAGETVAAWVAAEVMQPFELSVGPLVRVRLLRVGAAEHVVVLTMHHIVSDGWSVGVVVRELSALYAAARAGTPAALPAVAVQYADYAAWQRREMTGARLGRELAYWTERLAGAPPVLEVPTDRPRPAVRSNRGASVAFTVDAAVRRELEAVGRRTGATLYMVVLAAWQVLLGRYSGQTDVVVGTPIAGRVRPELEGVVGLFVNSLALRTDLSGDPTFTEVVRRVRETALGAYEHQEVPFERVVEALAPERNLSTTPIYQVALAWDEPMPPLTLDALAVDPMPTDVPGAKVDLTLRAWLDRDALRCQLEYDPDLWDCETIDRLAEYFRVLLGSVVQDPDRSINSLPLLGNRESHRIIAESNGEVRPAERFDFVHRVFERLVETEPDRIAIIDADRHVSYAALNCMANRVAQRLLARGVGPEVRVGICLPRGIDGLVAMLAVLKSGGAYVPVDPDLPPDRVAFTLSDAQASIVLTHERYRRICVSHGEALYLDRDWPVITPESNANPTVALAPAGLAYVIYTSGSTGRPKGVLVPHAAVANYVAGLTERIGAVGGASYAMVQSLAIDSVGTLIFGALCTGGVLHILHDEQIGDGAALAKYIREHRIDALKLAPTHLVALSESWDVAELIPRRWLILGGEALRVQWVEAWQRAAPHCAIFSHYGPTEAAVGMLMYRVGEVTLPATMRNVALGRPLPNTKAYTLDARCTPVPPGVPGEICIGGICLARGYHNRPALTAERFVPDPYSVHPGGRLYRTGDLARRSSTGLIEFVGRADFQVKIRGFRVELGEVEAVLATHPAIAEVVVHSTGTAGQERLTAYVVLRGHATLDAVEIRRFVKGRLPDHMVPVYHVSLPALPRSPYGKIDRRSLPPVRMALASQNAVLPATPVERALARVWCETLGVESIGVTDNLFDIGGHSLLAIRLVAKIRRAFQVQVRLRSLFERPTVRELSLIVENLMRADVISELAMQVPQGETP